MIIKGQKINDRYQIIRLIGEGGMANVYLAQDTILDRRVAVKVLRGDLADDEKFVRRFQREAISASSLNHPNIVEMYDVGEDDGKYFIVMEYVDGRTLKNLVKRRGSLTLHEVVDIMLQLTSAIAHAHDGYIIHRDIKPQNVLILDDGRLKITDFGIAMALNSNELTQTNSIMGSVHYLPPEQANGSGSTIKSDIYSLGILMFELLTGKIPFRGDNAVEIAIKQMKETIPSIRKIDPQIPQSVENIILKSCAKNPKNRYDNIVEMYNDIEKCLSEEMQNVERVVYKYPEQELEETKIMKPINPTPVKAAPVKIDKKDNKKTNKAIIILTSIVVGLIVLLSLVVIIVPQFTKVKEVKIPDLSKLSVVDAEKKLKDLGLAVAKDIDENPSADIDEGKVIGTRPQVGRSVKKGTEITIVVSSGFKGIIIEDYVGKNYMEIKGLLEGKGINVLITPKEVDDKTKFKENIIIEQKPVKGTKVAKGDIVTLVVPDIVTEYPDFVGEGWEIVDIEVFAEEYNLVLTIEYLETEKYSTGTIISQSRMPKSRVMNGATLKIVIASEPVVKEDPIDNLLPGGSDER